MTKEKTKPTSPIVETAPTIESTIALIQTLHAGQTDWAGRPYWEHPVAVMNLLGEDATDDEKMAALLHDVLEDTEATEQTLRDHGYPDTVIDLVRLLTRTKESGSYMDWIRSIAASGNRGAIEIKIADNRHNSDPARRPAMSEADALKADEMYRNRYSRSIAILDKALLK